MSNKLKFLAVTAALFGAGAGIHYRIPIVTGLVFAGLALFGAVTGVQMIVTRKADVPTSDSIDPHREHHTGLPAQLWGVLLLMFGALFGVFAIGVWLYGVNQPANIIDRIARSPLASGAVIASAGVAIGMYGLTRLLSPNTAFTETGLRPFE